MKTYDYDRADDDSCLARLSSSSESELLIKSISDESGIKLDELTKDCLVRWIIEHS